MITAPQLEALAHAATDWASPAMELTSRGNIQIRGIRDTEATAPVAQALAAAGLLPSDTHERVRNIVASPLSGRVGAEPRISAGWSVSWTPRFRRSPRWPALPGRFLFGIDDGRGDISGLAADVGNPPHSATRPHCYWPAATPASESRWTTRWATLVTVAAPLR